MDAIIIIIVFTSICTILSLGVGIASYLKYKQNLKYNPDLEYISFLKNAVNTTVSPAPASASTPALTSALTSALTPALTPAPALTTQAPIIENSKKKTLSGNEGDIAKFGCAVDIGNFSLGDAEGKIYDKNLYDNAIDLPTDLDYIKQNGGVLTKEIIPELIGKWKATYTCKKPINQGYSVDVFTELGGRVLTVKESATFEECKTECDNLGQCIGFNYSNKAYPNPHFYNRQWNSENKGECSLIGSMDNDKYSNDQNAFKKINIGQTLSCTGYDPKGTDSTLGFYRYMGNNKMSWYPNDTIAKSWDPKYEDVDHRFTEFYTDCIGFELGEDMKRKS